MPAPVSTQQIVITQFDRALDQAERLCADVPCEDCAALPHPHAKHPAWVLSHLAATNAFAAQMLGVDAGVPAAWGGDDVAGNRSVPNADRSRYATKQEMLDVLRSSAATLKDAYIAMDDDQLAAELPNEQFRSAFPTVGEAMHFIMAVHPQYHLGQLATWRQTAGFGTPA